MQGTTPERDWKYMKKIRNELLARFCERINSQAVAILSASDDSEHQEYLKLYRHIEEADHVIGMCFKDWRRSNLFMRILQIKRQGLLTATQLKDLSEETQERLRAVEDGL